MSLRNGGWRHRKSRKERKELFLFFSSSSICYQTRNHCQLTVPLKLLTNNSKPSLEVSAGKLIAGPNKLPPSWTFLNCTIKFGAGAFLSIVFNDGVIFTLLGGGGIWVDISYKSKGP